MATSFLALPTTADDGPGAGVDVSAMGALKTIVVEGNSSRTEPFVIVQFANDAAGVNWTTLTFFKTPGKQTVLCACRWLRAVVANYKGGGAPTVNVGGNDDGASFATLVAPAGSGNGVGVDISALPAFKTIQVTGEFRGALNVEVSNDGGATYSAAMTFLPGRAGFRSQLIVGEFMRINRAEVPPFNPGLPVITVGAAEPVSGGGGSGGVSLENGGVPLAGGPFTTLDLVGITAADAGGGTATLTSSGGGGDQTWYGDASDGDLLIPTGTFARLVDYFAYDTVTIQTGAGLYFNAFPLICRQLIIQGTGKLECGGGNAVGGNGGNGGNTQQLKTLKSGNTYTDQGPPGANGLQGRTGGAGAVNDNGVAGSNQNLHPLRELDGSTGGDGGGSSGNVGGTGGIYFGFETCNTNPFIAMGKTEQEPTDFQNWVGGGAGGGGGASGGGGQGGGGGGGGGVGRLYAAVIDAPAGSITANGGNGANGGGEVQNGGGGGGGMGGILLVITDELADPTIFDVTGGNGGNGAGVGAAGTAGDPGVVKAVSPISGPLL